MRELEDELSIISGRLETAQSRLNHIAVKVDEVILNFDLCDSSNDMLRDWYDDFCRMAANVDISQLDFDDFAFDGDSIRIEENDETV